MDAGHGWLIFALPPAELAVHPSHSNDSHELFFMCDGVQAFIALADSGSFTRAAGGLHVTQTAVSVRVQSLEAQLGRKLFVRNKAGATLTPASHGL